MNVVEFGIISKDKLDIEDLGVSIVDDYFKIWRNEFEEKSGVKFTDDIYNDLTLDIWSTVSDSVLSLIQEDFLGEKDEYVLSIIKQRVERYKDRVINLLEKGIILDGGVVLKNNVVSLFR